MALVFPFVLAVVAAATLLLAPAGGSTTPASTAVDGSDATAGPQEPSGLVPVDQMPVSDGRGTVITVPQDAVEHAPVTAEPDPELAAAGAAATPPAPADVPSRTDPGSPAAASQPTDPAYAPVYFMPVEGVSVADVPPTFGDPRGTDRRHAGVDILAPRGTPVRAAAAGTVWRAGESRNGGISVTVIGDDGVRYFYTHLDALAPGLEQRQRVGVDTVIGYVGNTGNAAATAPHLHFEVALPVAGDDYAWTPIDPLPHMLDRPSAPGLP